MLTESPPPQGDLGLFEQETNGDPASETLNWGRIVLRALAKQEGVVHVWLGLMDKKQPIRWLADLPSQAKPLQFSNETIDGVIQTGKAVTFVDHDELISGGLFPLKGSAGVFGVIGLLSDQTNYFSAESMKWATTLVEMVAKSAVMKQGRGSMETASLSRMLQSSLDVKEILPSVLKTLADLMDADAITVLHHESLFNGRFELFMAHGLQSNELAKLIFHFDVGITQQTFNNRPLWIPDLASPSEQGLPVEPLQETGFRGYLAMPLLIRNSLIGVVEFAWRTPIYSITWDWKELETAMEQIAFAMDRTYVLQGYRTKVATLTTRYDAMIEGLSRALELRDLETEGHTRRVSELTMQLVEHMNIPADQWDSIRQGALLHDIGKIGIPDAILLKPGSLTDQEKKVMQQHVIYGYNILAPIMDTRRILDITLYHHERWDGSGYPRGLKEVQIPLVARLFSVVDVFDALTSDRPYRTAWSRSKLSSM